MFQENDSIMDHGLRNGIKGMNREKVMEIIMMNFET